nr:MAG TPA: hypothetical protein [Herelleviridae sp.]
MGRAAGIPARGSGMPTLIPRWTQRNLRRSSGEFIRFRIPFIFI